MSQTKDLTFSPLLNPKKTLLYRNRAMKKTHSYTKRIYYYCDSWFINKICSTLDCIWIHSLILGCRKATTTSVLLLLFICWNVFPCVLTPFYLQNIINLFSLQKYCFESFPNKKYFSLIFRIIFISLTYVFQSCIYLMVLSHLTY